MLPKCNCWTTFGLLYLFCQNRPLRGNAIHKGGRPPSTTLTEAGLPTHTGHPPELKAQHDRRERQRRRGRPPQGSTLRSPTAGASQQRGQGGTRPRGPFPLLRYATPAGAIRRRRVRACSARPSKARAHPWRHDQEMEQHKSDAPASNSALAGTNESRRRLGQRTRAGPGLMGGRETAPGTGSRARFWALSHFGADSPLRTSGPRLSDRAYRTAS